MFTGMEIILTTGYNLPLIKDVNLIIYVDFVVNFYLHCLWELCLGNLHIISHNHILYVMPSEPLANDKNNLLYYLHCVYCIAFTLQVIKCTVKSTSCLTLWTLPRYRKRQNVDLKYEWSSLTLLLTLYCSCNN